MIRVRVKYSQQYWPVLGIWTAEQFTKWKKGKCRKKMYPDKIKFMNAKINQTKITYKFIFI